ncbi:MAG: radical SAM protein, partial [Bacteroidota bacterium]
MNSGRRYIFGPVPSRRLGRSLGVDVIPHKLCNLDCVYCEVGPTDKRAMRRQEYCPADAIIAELKEALAEQPEIDTITFSGAGEPTLNSKLGEIIHATKGLSALPVAVLTNGTLLYLEAVRNDLREADIVLPSLDAVSSRMFGMVNRPHPALQIETIIEGLKTFRKEFHGQIWLEILFVKGLNDERSEVERLRRAVREIQPDKVQLNTIIRPPTNAVFEPVAEKELFRLRELFGETCEVIGVSSARPVT